MQSGWFSDVLKIARQTGQRGLAPESAKSHLKPELAWASIGCKYSHFNASLVWCGELKRADSMGWLIFPMGVFPTPIRLLPIGHVLRRICGLLLFKFQITAGHRVITHMPPGVAAPDAPDGQPRAFEGAVSRQSLKRISRTCRLIAAIMPNPRRKDQPVGPNGQGEYAGQNAHLPRGR